MTQMNGPVSQGLSSVCVRVCGLEANGMTVALVLVECLSGHSQETDTTDTLDTLRVKSDQPLRLQCDKVGFG